MAESAYERARRIAQQKTQGLEMVSGTEHDPKVYCDICGTPDSPENMTVTDLGAMGKWATCDGCSHGEY